MALLREKFPSRVISRFADVNCPPRSDSTALDLFVELCEDLVYKRLIPEHLRINIHQVMAEVPPNMWQKKCSKITSN